MNSDQLEGNWKQLKGAVKEKWGKLTDDDFAMAQGKAEVLAGKLQEHYGMTLEEAKKQMDAFIKSQSTHSG